MEECLSEKRGKEFAPISRWKSNAVSDPAFKQFGACVAKMDAAALTESRIEAGFRNRKGAYPAVSPPMDGCAALLVVFSAMRRISRSGHFMGKGVRFMALFPPQAGNHLLGIGSGKYAAAGYKHVCTSLQA